MVENTKDLYNFILSAQYKNILDQLVDLTGISIYTEYDETIFKFDKNRLEMSNVSLHDMETLMQTDNSQFISFCAAKIELFKSQPNKQEFPKGEETEDFDQKEQLLGFSRGILAMYAIEFLLARKGQKDLEEYAKKARIPFAKKYAQDILKLIAPSS